MTRKILAFGLVLALLVSCFALSAGAQDASLYVSYKIPTDSIDIILTAPDAESANVVITDEEENFTIDTTEFALLRELKKGADGKFSYNAAMPPSSGSGKYYVTVVTDTNDVFKDSFWYMSENQAAEELTVLADTSISSLTTVQMQDLGMDIDEFNADAAKITEAYTKFKSDGTPDKKEFLTAYAYACLFGKTAGEEDLALVESLFRAQASRVGFDVAGFDALDAASKKWFLNKLTEGEYGNAEPSKLLNEWFSLADINNTEKDTVENFKHLLFTKHADTVVLNSADVTNYNGSSQKDDIILKFIQERPFADMNELTSAFNTAVSAYVSDDDDAGGGSTGGNSGSSGSGGKTSQTKFENASADASNSIFTDVPVSHWAYTRIKSLYDKGIVAGKGDNKFFPEDSVTRAEFAKIISMAFFKTHEASDISYSDVSSSAWYYEHVAKLSGLGIILGDDRGCFNPDAPITRQDAAVIIRRVTETRSKELPITRTYSGFNDDSSISGYAKDSIVALYEAGLINGMTAGEFAPLNKLTRAQAVQMVSVIME